jgi:hypothetical protein
VVVVRLMLMKLVAQAVQAAVVVVTVAVVM